jgi:hypothetical protein
MDSRMERVEKLLRGISYKVFELDKKITEQGEKINEQALIAINQAMVENDNKPPELRKGYRATWRHELYFNANDDKHARDIWDNIDTGNLTQEATRFTKEIDLYNEFVEEVSFDCIDDDYRRVSVHPE